MTLPLLRCGRCDRWIHYPRGRCPGCLSDQLVSANARGEGSVYAWVAPRGEVDPPGTVVAIVELDEGVRITANVEASGPSSWTVGDRVRTRSGSSAEHPWIFERLQPS
jgi:hypothetical protein